MSEFRIISPSRENIILMPGLPSQFERYKIMGASSMSASGDYGNMLFQNFKGEGFDIWYSNYLIKKTSTFEGTANDPLLEMHIPFFNYFKAWWEGLDNSDLINHQFEISYAPYSNTRASFIGGKEYHTFDIHFGKAFLYEYAKHCRLMAELVNKADKKVTHPVNMLDRVQLISFDMVRIINAILSYRFHEGLAQGYFTSLVKEFLTLLTIQVAGLTDKPQFSNLEKQKALDVYKIITRDFEEYHNVDQLAKMVGLKEARLQEVFKFLFHKTVWKFSQDARLDYAQEELQRSYIPLKDISFRVGYEDIGNFSNAFYRRFKYQPGEINKRRKRNG